MHVAPAEFRSVRNGGLTLRFAILDRVAYVLAEVPPSGSAGTRIEELCDRPHWAFVPGRTALVGNSSPPAVAIQGRLT